MTIERTLRMDNLGHETQFVVVDDCITAYGRTQWEAKLTEIALGYTKIAAIGGWRGKEEAITIYRVASLGEAHILGCVQFLLDAKWSPAIGRTMTDVYVVLPSGRAMGYCYEYPVAAIRLERWHGVNDFLARQSPAARAKFHGTRNTGWGSPADTLRGAGG